MWIRHSYPVCFRYIQLLFFICNWNWLWNAVGDLLPAQLLRDVLRGWKAVVFRNLLCRHIALFRDWNCALGSLGTSFGLNEPAGVARYPKMLLIRKEMRGVHRDLHLKQSLIYFSEENWSFQNMECGCVECIWWPFLEVLSSLSSALQACLSNGPWRCGCLAHRTLTWGLWLAQ